MTVRAKHPFVSYVGGVRRVFKRGDVVPAEIADRLAMHTEGEPDAPPIEAEPKPIKRTRKAAKSD